MKKHNRKFIMSLARAKGVNTMAEFAAFLKMHQHLLSGGRG